MRVRVVLRPLAWEGEGKGEEKGLSPASRRACIGLPALFLRNGDWRNRSHANWEVGGKGLASLEGSVVGVGEPEWHNFAAPREARGGIAEGQRGGYSSIGLRVHAKLGEEGGRPHRGRKTHGCRLPAPLLRRSVAQPARDLGGQRTAPCPEGRFSSRETLAASIAATGNEHASFEG